MSVGRRSPALAAAFTLAVAGCSTPQSPPPGPSMAALAGSGSGYLGDGAPDTIRILPPAPKEGEARYEADRRVYRETRAARGSARWDWAIKDDQLTDVPNEFACAVGVRFEPGRTPRLAALFSRLGPDLRRAIDQPKNFYKRLRPFVIEDQGMCLSDAGKAQTAKSFDYPSGHSSTGWTYGLVLAELVPDRATEILIRGRSIGESRVVCGAHNFSAVEAARTNASALVAALHGSAAFRADMEAARAELAAYRLRAPKPAGCEAEAVLAKTPY